MKQSLDIQMKPLELIKFALPTMIANLFMSIYMTVDGIFVANCVNTNALSAVNIVMPYVMIVLALGTMIGTGGSAVVSLQLGQGRNEEAKQNFSFLSLVCFVACVAVSIVSLIFREPLLRVLGASDIIFDYCVDYATPLFFVAPLALLGMALQSFFIAAGNRLWEWPFLWQEVWQIFFLTGCLLLCLVGKLQELPLLPALVIPFRELPEFFTLQLQEREPFIL